jgi:hypothetical protein
VVAGLTRLFFARFWGKTTPPAWPPAYRRTPETGFAKSVLANAGEDCWKAL